MEPLAWRDAAVQSVTFMERTVGEGKLLRLVIGDITKVAADAIVNAANWALAGGGGVDGAIHRAGGRSIMQELDRIRAAEGGCPTGSAVMTSAGALPARYIFHAVGPVYRDGEHGEPELLASCYRKCLALAEQHDVKRISFPSISTGVYRYPVEEAARIALGEVRKHLEQRNTKVDEVIFVLFDQRTYGAYEDAVES